MLPYGRKNPLPPPLFRSGRRSSGLRQTMKQREMGVKRVETAGVYPFGFRGETAAVPSPRVRRLAISALPHITVAADRYNMGRVRRRILNFNPQTADIHIHNLQLAHIVVSPDHFE